MKKILNEYKEQIKYFISDKRYVFSVIIVALLSYGFTITHYSIGIDDLCFDRYVQGTYILSAKRWGTWALYNIFQINEFSPFWLDAIVVILMILFTLILCTFIKKHFGEKIKIWGYIIFSALFLSNPIINNFFIYQSTNLAIVISNLITIICGIIIFENYFSKNKKDINLLCGLILTFPISMYESCAQTYIVFLFVTIFIKLVQGKETNKKLFKYFALSISMLILGLVLYFAIGKILIFLLEKFNLLETNFAYTEIFWLSEDFKAMTLKWKIIYIYETVIKMYSVGWKTFPVLTFLSFSLIAIVSEVINLIKTKKVLRLIIVLGVIFSNYILMLIMIAALLRTQFSWIMATAFLGLYIYQKFYNKKVTKYITIIALVMLIINQTRMLNQDFYNDYKRYEHDKVIANDIGISVIKECDYKNKPLLCVKEEDKGFKYAKNMDNSVSVIAWGTSAFEEYQTETTKFINEQGYDFKYITKEQARDAYMQYNKLDEDTKDRHIIELENVIIVNLNIYDF